MQARFDPAFIQVWKFIIANGMNDSFLGLARRYDGPNYAADDRNGKPQRFYQGHADRDTRAA